MSFGDPNPTGLYTQTLDNTSTYSNVYVSGGYPCSSCGVWVNYNTTHACHATYPQQQIIIYPQPYLAPQVDPRILERLHECEERLLLMQGALERLMVLLDNDQDEEVCGYSEGAGDSADSEGSPGTALEISQAPNPRGATAWPPRS